MTVSGLTVLVLAGLTAGVGLSSALMLDPPPGGRLRWFVASFAVLCGAFALVPG